jgi:uncharacterized membrane protein YbhN (UPF0104 family)
VLYPALALGAWGSLAALSSVVVAINLSIIVLLRRPGTVEWAGRTGKKVAQGFRGGQYAEQVGSSVDRTIESFTLARCSCGGEDRRLVTLAAILTVPVWALEYARLTMIIAALGVLAPLPAVVIASALSLTLQMFLPGGSGNVAAIAQIFSGLGVSLATATAAGLLSVATSIWISVPVALAVLAFTTRRGVSGPANGASDRRDDS